MAAPLCSDCVKGCFLPGEPEGAIEQSTGAYFIAGSNQSAEPKTAIVLLTDAYGLPLKNCKVVADTFSKRLGCDVWVPDIFAGRPLLGVCELVHNFPARAGEKLSLMNVLTMILTLLRNLPTLIRQRASVVDARIDAFLTRLKVEHKYDKLGVVGYCFGGAAAVRLGGRGLVDSVVACHPGPFSKTELMAVSVPISWVCAEDDMYFSEKARLNAETEFARRKSDGNDVAYQFRVYKGTVHGFAIRPNLENPEVKAGYEGALDQATEWLKKTLFV